MTQRRAGDLASSRYAAARALRRAGYGLEPGTRVETPHGHGRVLLVERESSFDFGRPLTQVWVWVQFDNGDKRGVKAADVIPLERNSVRP